MKTPAKAGQDKADSGFRDWTGGLIDLKHGLLTIGGVKPRSKNRRQKFEVATAEDCEIQWEMN